MTNDLALPDPAGLIPSGLTRLAHLGSAADRIAAQSVFEDYRGRQAKHTVRRHDGDLRLFAEYLAAAGGAMESNELSSSPEAWRGVTWGLVEGFVRWQLQQGYAVGSVNVRLSTVKLYCQLAMKAGAISPEACALIRAVSGYSQTEGKRVDEKRETTRRGEKKPQAVSITKEQAGALKAQPDTPQGRRDGLLMCLLLDHGLRVSEVAALTVEGFDLKAGTLAFYRQKVSKTQTHTLTAESLRAAIAYLQQDAAEHGPLLRGSRKGGKLEGSMGTRRITERVKVLGERIGIAGLSPHDCRHYWATAATRGGTHPFALQEAGGWNSLAMPRRYTEAAKIANEGVKLD